MIFEVAYVICFFIFIRVRRYVIPKYPNVWQDVDEISLCTQKLNLYFSSFAIYCYSK